MAPPWILFIIFYIQCLSQNHTETYDCVGVDACKSQLIQCKSQTDCVIVCNGKTACLDLMVVGLHAMDVTVICTPEDTCKGATIVCGHGQCVLDCWAAHGKNICNGVTVHINNALSFQCPHDCPTNVALLTFTSNPTTHKPTTHRIIVDIPTQTSTDPINTTLNLTSNIPTSAPSNIPTNTASPSSNPIHSPSKIPTRNPTGTQTLFSSNLPTFIPTLKPSKAPSNTPTNLPTIHPTLDPTALPTYYPTLQPTHAPSDSVTFTVHTDDDMDKHTPSPISRYIPHINNTKIGPLKPDENVDENASMIERLSNVNILWYISTAALIILCCSLCILLAFCLSIKADTKCVESDASSVSSDCHNIVGLRKVVSDTYSPMNKYEKYEKENKNSNAESSISISDRNIEYEDYEEYDEYDELREGSTWTPNITPFIPTDDDSKQTILKDRFKRVPSHSQSTFESTYPSILSLAAANNVFCIDPLDDDTEQDVAYDANYWRIAKLRGQSLSINVWSDGLHNNDDDSDFDVNTEIDSIFTMPISQVTLDKEPSERQSPTLNSVDSLFDND